MSIPARYSGVCPECGERWQPGDAASGGVQHDHPHPEREKKGLAMSVRAMGSHQSARSKSTTWLTPLSIVAALGSFDLDPCGYPGWETADRLICLPDDGLSAEWSGRVWLNPPYGAEVWQWLAKLAAHGQGTALIFARTETEGFVREVWDKATAVKFLYGRLHFHYPDGTRAPANSGAPSVLVAYGPLDAAQLSASSLSGAFVRLRETALPHLAKEAS